MFLLSKNQEFPSKIQPLKLAKCFKYDQKEKKYDLQKNYPKENS